MTDEVSGRQDLDGDREGLVLVEAGWSSGRVADPEGEFLRRTNDIMDSRIRQVLMMRASLLYPEASCWEVHLLQLAECIQGGANPVASRESKWNSVPANSGARVLQGPGNNPILQCIFSCSAQ